jgi:apolipoprotein N-acyltransferase
VAFASKYERSATALFVIASASALVWFGNGLDPWWPLLWFAPLPVLVFALRSAWSSAALVAGLSWLIGGLNMWHYLRALGAPPSAWAGIFFIVALVFAGAVLLFRVLVRHGALWSALLAFPATWVSYEWVRDVITPHGTAGSFAYTQLNFLPFLQLASMTGPWGMSFVLLLFPAALAIALHVRKTALKQALRVLGAALGVIALVLIFGAVRLALPQSHQVVRVGLVASDAPANVGVADEAAKTERLFRDYAAEAEKLSRRGAQIVVLPEKLGVIVDPEAPSADAIFQSLADKTKSTIIVGLVHVSNPVKYNEARLYAPGAPVLSYDKHHMLPPFESNLKPGTTLTLMRKPFETRGVAICKDMDFTRLSRRYGHEGVGLMLVPAWDFNMDRWWHGHIAVMRGVEDGFSVVRAAKDGYLTVSDDRGRIMAETRSDSAPFATLLADVPAGHDGTLYVLMGDWFPWFALATLVFALIQLYRLRRWQPDNFSNGDVLLSDRHVSYS